MAHRLRPQDNKWFQDPDDKFDYKIDWSNAIPDGDEISESTWTDESGDLTLSAESIAGDSTVVWISGTVDGTTHKVRNEITTVAGRKLTESLYIVGKSK